ncbi:MAG: MFS transporter, partial [Acidimicrobiales bacterium]|nr:MFS transporter [Acidimicrobiales bacterium]
MSQLVTDVEPTVPGGLERLWKRQLSNYPGNGARTGFLGLSVVITVVLYFQQYIAGAIGPSIISYFHISFRYYLYVTVLSSAFGAFASLVAGLADRWGRANIVVYGLLAASLITLFGIPHAKSATEYVAFVCMVGIVEGLVLVATPALIRDFSPQLGRGAAMGFWTLGPVIGSLKVSEVSSHSIPHLHAWQEQYRIKERVDI